MLTILAILPLVAAAFLALLMRKRGAKHIRYVALVASLLSLALIAMSYLNPVGVQSISWFSVAGYSFTISTTTAPLNMLLLLIVGIVTPLVVLYSAGFMNVPSEQPRYYFELLIFASAMMLFAMAADFITIFMGWELLGITSYLLIGFWHQREGTASAARKAVTTILIGDIMLLAAILIIWGTYNTFSIATVLQQAGQHNAAMAIALVLIMFAAFTKSAQFPFHEWLPDAMKGPTPVSAFLHSSTMVKAGVFLVAVLLPLFVAYHMLPVLLIFGIITTILGVTNAIAESNIKRVLAYSTLEDLGLMFVALGTGSLAAAMMLLVVQAFYKALLFMCAGSIIKANGNEEDMNKLHNSKSYWKLFIPTAIGAVSLAGLFPLSGFFGKAAVEAAASSNMLVYAVLVLVAFLSNLYIFRWLFMPMRKKSEHRLGIGSNYRTLPNSMMLPIYILAIITIIAAVAYVYIPTYLVQYAPAPLNIGIVEVGISIAVFVAGVLLAYYAFYIKNYSLDPEGMLYKLVYNNLLTNTVYLYVTKAFGAVSTGLDDFDRGLYNFIKGGAHGVGAIADTLKKGENGNVNTYIAALVIGLIVVLVVFML